VASCPELIQITVKLGLAGRTMWKAYFGNVVERMAAPLGGRIELRELEKQRVTILKRNWNEALESLEEREFEVT
jgi:hypothetical protein